MSRTKTAPARKTISRKAAGDVVDLDNYAPAYLTWIANKLSSGASQAYLAAFDVGIESWRVLVLLAIEGSISAQKACGIIGMDKASMSRCFKTMQARGFIELALDPLDGRARIATLTPAGRAVHDQIRDIAMERERVFMSVLTVAERRTFLDLLRRLHENLPAVEAATREHLGRHHPHALQRRSAKNSDS
ncbi:MarR family winged helix-turn-helix transcriptional regulator [Variovorax sp. YR216]|uniref:MarR family winged helix-turn-helix transcriptional regulator n=1 Tax=Variovorax sp. YR216 TaxID=1882828 RepID=UPI00089A818A|nr:MarR family transcriptional regulator [Variovorax sp. YR216]SEB22422.1 DNA-binding transcriptional regulator, MarR family [Variovorax sp. YR216]